MPPRKTADCKFGAVKKETPKQPAFETFIGIVNDKATRDLLIKTVMEICKSRTEENTAMRILERDLAQTSKALSNLLKAIESGIFTESIKQRLEELEAEKRALQEKILIEQSKELYQLTEKDVEKTPAAWSETKAENDDRPSGRKDWRIQRKTRDHFAAYAADAERYTAERHN